MAEGRCAVLPAGSADHLEQAVVEAGGQVVAPDEAEAVIWADPTDPDGLAAVLAEHPGISWVQLPWAGIEPFVGVLDEQRIWTCGKGVYAAPVAEHALACALAGLREVVHYARLRSFGAPHGRNLLGSRVTVLGGGGIAASLLRLLAPFDARVTVVRRHPDPVAGAERTVGPEHLHEALSDADAVVLALALTPETEHIVDAAALAAMPSHAWLVNVARGRHVDQDALVAALDAGDIGGAALDVTEPEPLPEDHPLWHHERCVITPHVGNTPEMGRELITARVRENVRRWRDDRPLLGPVDARLGY